MAGAYSVQRCVSVAVCGDAPTAGWLALYALITLHLLPDLLLAAGIRSRSSLQQTSTARRIERADFSRVDEDIDLDISINIDIYIYIYI